MVCLEVDQRHVASHASSTWRRMLGLRRVPVDGPNPAKQFDEISAPVLEIVLIPDTMFSCEGHDLCAHAVHVSAPEDT